MPPINFKSASNTTCSVTHARTLAAGDAHTTPHLTSPRHGTAMELAGGGGHGHGELSHNAAWDPSVPRFPTAGAAAVAAGVSDALRDVLAGLGASSPVYAGSKDMVPSDRNGDQNRLLISCKRSRKNSGNGDRIAFAGVFTEKEKIQVHRAPAPKKPAESEKTHDKKKRKRGKVKTKAKKSGSAGEEEGDGDEPETEKEKEKEKKEKENGLAVQAYDGGGRPYGLRLRFLTSNSAFRIIGKDWKAFLGNNALLLQKPSPSDGRSSSPDEEGLDDGEPPERDAADHDPVSIQLWAFRSRKLPCGEDDHPDGRLGLVMLLHRREADGAAQAAAEEEDALEAEDDAADADADADDDDDDDDAGGDPQAPPMNEHAAATQDGGLSAHTVPAAADDAAGGVQEEDTAAAVPGADGEVREAAPPRAPREPGLTPWEVLCSQALPVMRSRHRKQDGVGASHCTCKQVPNECKCS
ncbi:hypothetical protein ACP4OV_016439 [Aristida adscensionis]